jgi:uncharacterized membrane protein YcfT
MNSLPRAGAVERNTSRKPWLDIAKGLSIVAVVLFHAGSMSPEGTTARKVWSIVDLGLFTFIMPLFFLVSGLVMGSALQLRFRAFFQRRIWPVVYLFIIWVLIYAVASLASRGRIGNSLFESLTLQSVLWYLAALSIYMLIAWLTRNVPLLVVLAVALLVAAPFAILFPFDGWGLAHGPHFFVFFLAGCRVARKIEHAVERARWRQVGFLAFVAAALAALAFVLPASRPAIYALTPLVSVPLVLIASMQLSRWPSASAQIGRLGVGSLAIFVVHNLVLDLLNFLVVPAVDWVVVLQWSLPALGALLAVVLAMGLWVQRARYPLLFRPPVRRKLS